MGGTNKASLFADEQAQALFDAVPEAVVLVEFVDCEPVIRDYNERFEDLFGYGAADLRGEPINDYILPDEQQAHRSAATIDERAARGEVVEREITRKTADGTRDFLFRSQPFSQDEVVKSIGIYTDITDRQRERQRYETLIEQSSDIIGILEGDGTFRYLSPMVEEILGFSPEELVGENCFEYVHPADQEAVMAEFQRSLEDPSIKSKVECRYRSADGEWRWLESIGSNHIDRPPIEGYVVNTRDVTERKQRERTLEQQNERLDQFASIVSHDIRNPLNVAQLRLEQAQLDIDDCEHLDIIEQQHERMQTLFEDLLQLARAGQSAGERSTVELPEIAQHAWESVDTADASLVVDTERTVQANPSRLRQLFENLITNAVTYGGESVTVTVSDCPDGNGFVVEDDGPGIPPDECDRVFEPGVSSDPDGTGYGLAIVEEIASSHGWTVGLNEGPAGGACFEISGVGPQAD